MRKRWSIHSLPVSYAMLWMAALLVPRQRRAEWLLEWRSELWHAWELCNRQEGGGEKVTRFCCGAFQDAFWFRRNDAAPATRRAFRPGTPSRCIVVLSTVAGAALVLAICLPPVRALLQPNPYRDADRLLMIARGGLGSAPFPTIPYAEYRAWTANTHPFFTHLAFYQPIVGQIHTGLHSPADLRIAHASGNLFDLLDMPIAFEVPRSRDDSARLFLSQAAWRTYFHSDPRMLDRTLQVDGQDALLAGVIEDDDWRLPGRVQAWLLESDKGLAAFDLHTEGYVLARTATQPRDRPQMYVPRGDDGYERFECESLADRIREPFMIFLFSLLLALLALPATTSLPLGDYPANRDQVPWTTSVRRWVFLCLKFTLIVAIVCIGSLDLAYGITSMTLATSEYLQFFISFWSLLIAFRWVLRDQRQRCPVCLRTLTNPARVGQFSRNFLAWNGTELVCLGGHGLLHVPDLPTSWFSSQRWLYLDTSWGGLFARDSLPSAGML